MAVDASVYAAVKKDLLELIRTKKCNPLMIRLAWHDSGTYDKVRQCPAIFAMSAGGRSAVPFLVANTSFTSRVQSISSFPQRGGANGSVRFKPECDHAANAGADSVLISALPLAQGTVP